MDTGTKETEIIRSSQVLKQDEVGRVETRGEIIRIKASMWIVAATLLIGCATLALSIVDDKVELQTWATGLISGITGAALGYGLNHRSGA
jgi:hypothetical protein